MAPAIFKILFRSCQHTGISLKKDLSLSLPADLKQDFKCVACKIQALGRGDGAESHDLFCILHYEEAGVAHIVT